MLLAVVGPSYIHVIAYLFLIDSSQYSTRAFLYTAHPTSPASTLLR